MKVGIAVYGDLEIPTGGYLYDRMLVRHLRERGDQVEVVGLPRRSPEASMLDNLDPRLLRRLTGMEIDVLVQDELCYPSFCLLNHRLVRSVDYPIVSIVHHLTCQAETCAGKRQRYRIMEERYLSSLDGFIFNSQATRESVNDLIPGQEGVVAYPGKDHLTASPVRSSPSLTIPLRIIYLGNLLPHKGLDVLLRAMALLPRGAVRLEVVGAPLDHRFTDKVATLVGELGLEDDVHFHGRLSDLERDTVMDRCHALAVPSHHEGYGLAYVEALARGLPAIASASGGAAEIISHGREGYLVRPGDYEGLAECLERLRSDPGTLEAMAENALLRYRSLPTWGEEMEKARNYLCGLCR